MRKLLGRGTPRGLQDYQAALLFTLSRLWREVGGLCQVFFVNVVSVAGLNPD
jgi:hypothetical protein